MFLFSQKPYNIFMIEKEYSISEEDYLISIEDLKKKFNNWFGKPVPAEPPHPAEVEPSMGRPVPVDLPLPAIETQSRHAGNSHKFSDTLNLGFNGAISFGAVVGITLVVLNLSFPGWYGDTWPSQFIIIFLAILLGFNIGLSKGYVAQQREKYFYNGEL